MPMYHHEGRYAATARPDLAPPGTVSHLSGRYPGWVSTCRQWMSRAPNPFGVEDLYATPGALEAAMTAGAVLTVVSAGGVDWPWVPVDLEAEG